MIIGQFVVFWLTMIFHQQNSSSDKCSHDHVLKIDGRLCSINAMRHAHLTDFKESGYKVLFQINPPTFFLKPEFLKPQMWPFPIAFSRFAFSLARMARDVDLLSSLPFIETIRFSGSHKAYLLKCVCHQYVDVV